VSLAWIKLGAVHERNPSRQSTPGAYRRLRDSIIADVLGMLVTWLGDLLLVQPWAALPPPTLFAFVLLLVGLRLAAWRHRHCGEAMTESRRKFDEDFKQGAVRIVRETGKPIAQLARELGINEETLGNWCVKDRRSRAGADAPWGEDERAELIRLRRENAELAMQRDVLKRSVALRVGEAIRR
jgi:transposase